MEFTLEPTHQPEATSEQVPVPPPTAELSGVDKKRANKTATCPHCNKTMSKKTLRYSHYCQRIKEEESNPVSEVTPPANPKPEIIKEVVREEITENHIKDYIMRKETERRELLAQQRTQRFNTLMSRAF